MRSRSFTALAVVAVAATCVPVGLLPSTASADTCPATTATILGTPGDDRLTGTPGADVVHGLGGDDVLDGGAGDDVLCGGAGTDRLLGRAGDDRLHGGRNGLQQLFEEEPPDNVGDTLLPGPGDDYVDPGWDVETDAGGGFRPDVISYQPAVGPVHVDLSRASASGEGADVLHVEGRVTVVGSLFDDVLVGSALDDDLVGGPGGDLLRGLGGDDTLEADPESYGRPNVPHGGDTVYGGAGGDSIRLGDGDDVARGDAGGDTFVHGSGTVDIDAGPGRDYLETDIAFAAGQRVVGGAGRDELYLWAVADPAGRHLRVAGRIDLAAGVLRMELGDRSVRAELAGVERFRAPDGVWRIIGTDADEVLYGPESDWSRVVVRAGGGDDLLTGTAGDDVLDGGTGRDRAGDDRGDDLCISIERYLGSRRCERVR